METLNASIYFNMAPMRRALQRFDADGCARVTAEDFVTALRGVSTALGPDGGGLSRIEIDQLAANLPRTYDKMIDYETFLRSFHIVDTHLTGVGAKSAAAPVPG